MVPLDPFKSQTHSKRLEIIGMVSQSCLIGVTLRKRLPLRFPHEVVHLKHTHAHTHPHPVLTIVNNGHSVN